VSLRQLLPSCQDNPDLAARYAYPDGLWLRANMVSSADGAANLEGASAALSSDTDRRLFALLRALSDVIIVGAATVRTERYKPARISEPWRHLRDGRTPTPPIAVVMTIVRAYGGAAVTRGLSGARSSRPVTTAIGGVGVRPSRR
jgi:hypothetical protein